MLRRVLITMFVSAIAAVIFPVAAMATFPDVPPHHWAYDAVQFLEEEGLVLGYPDGTFQGNRQLTRYEFAMVVSRVYEKLNQMIEELGMEPSIDEMAVIEMLREEFDPEIKELRDMIQANTEKITALEEKTKGIDERLTKLEATVGGKAATMGKTYGDLRLRLQGKFPEVGTEDKGVKYRFRYGFTQTINSEVKFGGRFASGSTGEITSTNEDIEDAFGTDPINIDLAYLQYSPKFFPGLTVWLGKFTPPWITTPLVWDSDVTVEGAAQSYKFKLMDGSVRLNLAELIPTDEGGYLVAQIAVQDILLKGIGGAFTYHYMSPGAWAGGVNPGIMGKMRLKDPYTGKYYLGNGVWDFTRLDINSLDTYQAIEGYGSIKVALADIPIKLEGNYLMNLAETAEGLDDAAGWQLAAMAKLSLWDKLSNPGDFNLWAEWGRAQPNSVMDWLTDADRGAGGSEWIAGGLNYRFLKNTDICISYFSVTRLHWEDPRPDYDLLQLDCVTKF